jgi:hypothetical protein
VRNDAVGVAKRSHCLHKHSGLTPVPDSGLTKPPKAPQILLTDWPGPQKGEQGASGRDAMAAASPSPDTDHARQLRKAVITWIPDHTGKDISAGYDKTGKPV